jgi:hypothetical protein
LKKTSKTEIETDRENYLALSLLAESDGGKVIIANLLKDVAGTVERLSMDYKTATHFEIVRLCSDLNSKLSLYRSLTRAKGQLEIVDDVIASLSNE